MASADGKAAFGAPCLAGTFDCGCATAAVAAAVGASLQTHCACARLLG